MENNIGPENNTILKRHDKTINTPKLEIERGETQKNVNKAILGYLRTRFNEGQSFKSLDVPCGSMLFASYVSTFFPKATVVGADIKKPLTQDNVQFIGMDLTKDFELDPKEKFDLITSISGVMMFGNTLNFIANCAEYLKKGGLFIVANDNFSTIKDKLSLLLTGRNRLFNLFYSEKEEVTQQIPIQELCRLLLINGLTIQSIEYTSFYIKDLIYLPFALLIYPVQYAYMKYKKVQLPATLKRQMFPFKHYFCKHYIIYSCK